MQQWKEVEHGRLWLTSVGNVLTVYVAKTSAGDFEARVVGMNGIIEIAANINFGRIAQDVGLAMAHRILRDEMLRLEGSAPTASDSAAELAALRDENARLREDNAALRREIEANVIEAVAAHDLQQHAERMAEAIKVYFNRRGVQHADRRGNEYIAEMADALSDYGFAMNLKGGNTQP